MNSSENKENKDILDMLKEQTESASTDGHINTQVIDEASLTDDDIKQILEREFFLNDKSNVSISDEYVVDTEGFMSTSEIEVLEESSKIEEETEDEIEEIVEEPVEETIEEIVEEPIVDEIDEVVCEVLEETDLIVEETVEEIVEEAVEEVVEETVEEIVEEAVEENEPSYEPTVLFEACEVEESDEISEEIDSVEKDSVEENTVAPEINAEESQEEIF